MVSGEHAHIRCQEGVCRLYDGSPGGKPSLNGTFVNGRPVPAEGQPLRDGDAIILAALDPARPKADTPGAAAFTFEASCS
jgi:pSer/pThr/pTyr-binding forkhead associated (FHA) protein